MEKLSLFRSFILSVIICLLLFDGLRLLTNPADSLPVRHKEMLLIAALLWIASAMINQQSNDDDLAGQV